MSVRSTTAQFNALRGVATRPITLLRIEFSGAIECISLSGDGIEFDGEKFNTAGVELVSIDNSNSAVLSMPVTAERMAQTESGSWRGGRVCEIYEIPALPEDDEFVYDAVDGVLKIDGVIDNAQYANGKITVNILHKYLVGKFTPRYRVNDFTTTIPVAGSFLKVGSDKYQLKSRRQKTTERIKPKALRGRLTTQETNSFVADDRALDVETTADGAFMPIVLGRCPVPGMICANGVDGSGNFVYVVAWGIGPVLEISQIYNNNAALPSTAIVHNYRGIKCQGIDNYAATITGITYADDWRILTPNGYACGCYSVIVLPSSTTEVPRFQAIIKGVLGYDNREDGAADPLFIPDPFNQGDVLAVGYNLQFIGTNGTSPTAGMDKSSNAYSIAWFGNAQIQSNKLSLDGDGDYVTRASVANTRFGTGKWTLEITCTPTNAAENNNIFGIGDSSSDRCILLLQASASFNASLSSNGSSWDLHNGAVDASAFSAGVTTQIVIEFDDEFGYHFYVDGEHKLFVASTSSLFASTSTIYIGQWQGASASAAFKGTISGVRMTKGYNRYGGVHTNTSLPYPDSDSNLSGYIYTDIVAANVAAFIKSPFYGLGVTEDITAIRTMFKHNEGTIGIQGVEHSVDLVISESRPSVEWLDHLCGTYGETFWFPEGDTIALRPDRIADKYNPSGWELTTNGELYDDADDWTLGSGWSHLGYLGVDALLAGGASSAVSQTIGKPTVAGDTYVITVSLDERVAGSLRVDLDGVTVIEAQTVSGVYAYEFVATGTETTISAVGASLIAAVDELSLRRKYWRDDSIVAGSLTITPLKNSDAPNRLIASYRKIESGTANWGDDIPITVEMPGVGEDGQAVLETRIRYDGLRSTSKTTAKAKAKLYRLQGKDSISWKTTDIGLLYQKGMVIELYDPEFELLVYVLLESVERVEQGRYLCRGTRYSDSHYPDNQEDQDGTIPVGLILPMLGTDVPSGWQAFTTADGKFIRCAGESLAVAGSGGATTHSAITGDTSTDGAHGPGEDTFPVESYTGTSGSGSGRRYTVFEAEAGGHDHGYDTGTITPDLYRAEMMLVKKITSTATVLPAVLMMFGKSGLEYQDMHRYAVWGKRLLMANDAMTVDGIYQQLLAITTDSTDNAHDHETYSSITNGSPSGTAVTATHYAAGSGGGPHTHAMLLDLLRNVARVKLCLYASGVEWGVGQGMIGFWDGTIASLHQDWSLCDGRLGTPFIEGRFIEIAAPGEEDERIGNNTLKLSGTTRWSPKHDHKGAADTDDTHAVVEISHSNRIRHRHTVQNPADNVAYTLHHDWVPPYYTLYPVMYNPNPVANQKDVALYIDGDQADGVTTIVDIGALNYTATIGGSGTLQYSDDQQLFGVNTLYKTSTKRISFAVFGWGKKWTIQGFFRNSTAGSVTYLFANNHDSFASRSFIVSKNASGNIELFTGSPITTSRATVTLGLGADEWYYVELSYDYANFRLYAGRVSSGIATRATYASAAFDPYPHFGIFDIPQGVFQTLLPFTGYAGHIRIVNGAALNTGAKLAIPSAKFQNWHSSHYLLGAYDWWNPCGIVDGHYTNLAPDQDQAILPWNPGGRSSLWRETGLTDLKLSVEWPGVHADGECGLMACMVEDESEFALGFNYESGLGSWVLWELGRQPNEISAIDLTVDAHTDGEPVTLSVEISGTTITCKANGVTKITHTIPAALQGSTRHGIFVDVNRVEGRPANVPGLVADFRINDSDDEWVFFYGEWDDLGYWKDSETIYI